MACSLFLLDKLDRVYKSPNPISQIAVNKTPPLKGAAHRYYCGKSWEIAVRFLSDKPLSDDIVDRKHITMPFPHVLIKPQQTIIQNNSEDKREFLAFSYSSEIAELLMRRGLLTGEIVWGFELTSSICRLTTEIRTLLGSICEFGTADQLDLLCLQLLQELALQRDTGKCKQEVRQVSGAASYMRFHMEDSIGIPEIAEKFGFSPRNLYRLWLQTYGMPPLEWLKRLRLENAATELATTTLTVKEIAARCGFHDAGYFANSFRKHYGVSPNKYRSHSLTILMKDENHAD